MRRRWLQCAVVVIGALMVVAGMRADGQSYTRAGAARFMQAQDWNGLLRYAEGWTRAEPNNPDGWAYMGMVYGLHLHEPGEAASAIQHSLQLNPNQPDGWEALGAAYIGLRQYADAVSAIRKAIQLNPNQYAYWDNLAVAYADEADWKDAMQTLDGEQPLAERLNNAQVWYVLGNGYLKLENAPKAVAAYQRCLRLKPNFAAGWTNLGVMLLWGGNPQGALQAYDRAAALGDQLARKNAADLRAAIAEQQRAAAQQNTNFNNPINRAYRTIIGNQMRAAQNAVGREP